MNKSTLIVACLGLFTASASAQSFKVASKGPVQTETQIRHAQLDEASAPAELFSSSQRKARKHPIWDTPDGTAYEYSLTTTYYDQQMDEFVTRSAIKSEVVIDGDDIYANVMDVTLKTDSGDYTTKFHSMQYYMWAHKTGEWHPYNSNVAALPLTMTRLPGTRAEGLAPAKERVATKASIHHGQLKAVSSARKSVAKKAVRMK